MSTSQETSSYELLQVGKWYAEIEDEGTYGLLYKCVDEFFDRGERIFVIEDESGGQRYQQGRSATTEFWMPQR